MTRTRQGHRDRHRTEREDRSARRAEAHARKREQMLDAAIGVVRRDGPAVSMREIAQAAGVTKPIVYRAFGDREGLTRAITERFTADLADALQEAIDAAPDDRARVAAAIDAYLSFIERDPSVIRFLVDRGLDTVSETGVAMSGFVRRVGQLVTQAIGDALRQRNLDTGVAEPWAYAIVGAVHLAGDWWLERRPMTRTQLVENLTALVWDGMRRFAEPTSDSTKGRSR